MRPERKITPDDDERAEHLEPSDGYTTQGAQPKGRQLFGVGNMANLCTFSIMVLGIVVRSIDPPAEECTEDSAMTPLQHTSKWLLAVGLFGFAGGFTNWLALKMLFDEIPGLVGSGIIPKRFMEVKEVGKATIMAAFFSPEYLDTFMRKKITQMTTSPGMTDKLVRILDSPEVDGKIEEKLQDLMTKPEFMMFAMMGMTPAQLKPLVKTFATSLFSGFLPMLPDVLDTTDLTTKIREMADEIMTQKLAEITAAEVQQLAEEVLWEYLEMLIVWGNIFGALIGIISVGAGYP